MPRRDPGHVDLGQAHELTTMIERRVCEPVKTEILHAAAAVTVTKRSKR
jgi:hypothetical protein